MNRAELKQEVKNLIHISETQEALELIDNFVTSSSKEYNSIEKTISICLGALNNAKEQWINGISNNSDYNETLNKLNLAALTLLDEIKEDDEVVSV